MKKSQALAALAFAFAMGIVAPVANTVSAFEVTGDQTATPATGTATCQDLTNALRTLKSNAGYKWYVAQQATVAKGYADIDASRVATAVRGSGRLTTGYTASTDGTDLQAMEAAFAATFTAADFDGSIENTRNSLNRIQSNAIYMAFEKLVAAKASPVHAGLSDAVDALRAALPGGVNLPNDPNDYVADYITNDVIGTTYNTGIVAWYTTFIGRVNDLQTQFDKTVEGKGAYEALLNQSNILSENGTAAYANVDTDTNPNVIRDLDIIAQNSGAVTSVDGTTSWALPLLTQGILDWYPLYASLVTEPDAPCDTTDTTERASYFGKIWSWATTYKAITGQTTVNTKDIAEYLINYVPTDEPDPSDPSDPSDPTDPSGPTTPGSTDDKKDDDKKAEDKKAEATKTGNQGVLATSAASASKTAGVMAAIATALTTAGAAVVAFRNARRNGNKEA